MATHSSILAWRIPGTEEPSGLPSMPSHRVAHDWSNLAAAAELVDSSTSPCYFRFRNEKWDVCKRGAVLLCNSWSPPVPSVQSLSRVGLFATPWIAASQASLSITNSWSSLRFTSIESVMPSSHLILCHPLLLLPPVPSWEILMNFLDSTYLSFSSCQ